MRLKTLLALLLIVVAPIAVCAQTITTVAGGGSTNVPALQYSIGGSEGIIKDVTTGDVYILDNFFNRIFKVNTAGNMTVFAGNGTAGFSGDGGLPTAAQLNGPSAMFRDAAGNFFIADSDNSVIREIPAVGGLHYGINMTAGNIYTIAGVPGTKDYNGDNQPATSAFMNVPDGVWVDKFGNVFIGDRFNEIVREVPVVDGPQFGIGMTHNNIYTIAGTVPVGHSPNDVPQFGFSGNGVRATGALLHDPWGVYGDGNGNIFIADSSNNAIREVAAVASGGLVVGDIYTVVNTAGTSGIGGDTGPATAAQLKIPHGVFVDAANNLFITDSSNHAIREVPATTAGTMIAGHIYTLAGTLGQIGTTGDTGNSGNGIPATTAGLAFPDNAFFDAATGDLFIANTDAHTVREVPSAAGTNYTVSMKAGDIYDIAGNHHISFGGDGKSATNAELSIPFDTATQAIGIAMDSSGSNLFIADTFNDVIREVSGGNIQTTVGAPGADNFGGDGGPAASGRINTPNGVFVDKAGNWFIADTGNCLIREVVAAGNITTVAGTVPAPSTLPNPPNPPVCGSLGDQGPATTTAQLNAPNTVFVDGSGNIFIADTGNNAIREIAATTGTNYGISMIAGNIYTVAGTLNVAAGYSIDGTLNTGSLLNGPTGVFVDGFGNIFVADTGNSVVREIPALRGTNYGIPMTTNSIYTVAGTVPTRGVPNSGFSGDTGPATSAMLNNPFAILVDPAGNIFISDTNNHVVREVAAVTGGGKTANHIYTVAGTPQVASFKGDGGLATAAELNTPQGLAASSGNLLVADSQNVRIRSIGPGLLSPPEPAITLAPTAVSFATPQFVATTSAAVPVILSNNGTATLNITGITPSGDFTQNNNCPTTLVAGSTCTINVMFSPTLRGTRSGSISVADSAAGSPHNVALSGTGIQPTADLSAPTLAFTPAQIVGTTSAAKSVTVTNNGNTALTFAATNAITLTGTNPGDFAFAPAGATACGTSLAMGASCTISVTFTPTAANPNPRSATITIADNAGNTPQTVALSGTGLPTPSTATLNGTGLTFATQLVGNASVAQSLTLTNNGTGALTFAATNPIILTGANPGDFAFAPASTCGTSLAGGGAKCTISVTFTPTTFGSRTATVTITDNAGGVTTPVQQTFSLTGMGAALSFAPASGGSTTQTVQAGQTATYNLQLSTAGGAPTDVISVAVACTGAPSLATCSGPSTPVSVVPGTPAAFAITVKTTGSNAVAPGAQFEPRMEPPVAMRTLPLFLLALLSIAALLSLMQSPAGRMRTLSVTMAACLVLLPMSAAMLLQGCGGGSSGGSTPPPVTTVAPSISTQPANQTVTAGQTASFSVVAAGTAPLTYQWQKNGTAITGATSASYTTPATLDTDNGAAFTVVVTNSAGNATSNAATMTVQFTPSATSNLTVTFTPTVNGKAQAAQTTTLTLVVQ